jgi:hypothetical protein
VLRPTTIPRWLVAGSLGLVTAVGCEDADSKDTGVDVVLDSAPGALGAASTSAAYLSLESVEMLPCGDASAFRLRSLVAIRSAWAHDPGTPTRIGVPALDDLATATKTVKLGTLTPPESTYCSVRLKFGPADADAVGMPSDRSVVGRTLWIAGRAGDPPTEFKLTTTETRTVEVPLPRFQAGDKGRRLTLHLSRPTGDALAGVDLAPSAIDESSRTVLDRLVGATRVEVR